MDVTTSGRYGRGPGQSAQSLSGKWEDVFLILMRGPWGKREGRLGQINIDGVRLSPVHIPVLEHRFDEYEVFSQQQGTMPTWESFPAGIGLADEDFFCAF
jgi:hypothetical protein